MLQKNPKVGLFAWCFSWIFSESKKPYKIYFSSSSVLLQCISESRYIATALHLSDLIFFCLANKKKKEKRKPVGIIDSSWIYEIITWNDIKGPYSPIGCEDMFKVCTSLKWKFNFERKHRGSKIIMQTFKKNFSF